MIRRTNSITSTSTTDFLESMSIHTTVTTASSVGVKSLLDDDDDDESDDDDDENDYDGQKHEHGHGNGHDRDYNDKWGRNSNEHDVHDVRHFEHTGMGNSKVNDSDNDSTTGTSRTDYTYSTPNHNATVKKHHYKKNNGIVLSPLQEHQNSNTSSNGINDDSNYNHNTGNNEQEKDGVIPNHGSTRSYDTTKWNHTHNYENYNNDNDIVNNIASWQALMKDYKQEHHQLQQQQKQQDRKRNNFLKSFTSSSSSSSSSLLRKNNDTMNNDNNEHRHHQIHELKSINQPPYDSKSTLQSSDIYTNTNHNTNKINNNNQNIEFQNQTHFQSMIQQSKSDQQHYQQSQPKKLNNQTLILNPSSSSSSTFIPPPSTTPSSSNNPTSQKLKNIINNVQFKRNMNNMLTKGMMMTRNNTLSSSTTISTFPLSQDNNAQQQQQQQQQQPNNYQTTTELIPTMTTAATFAKNASHAGYLSKLGDSISEYKRRFFVLKPTTCLYYFLSPNDVEPRGCIDLEDYDYYDNDDYESDYDKEDYDNDDRNNVENNQYRLQLNSLGSLPDGRFRFEIVLPLRKIHEKNNTTTNHNELKDDETKCNPIQQKRKKIVLEARNEQVGKEWMKLITTQRLSHSYKERRQLVKQIQSLNEEKNKLKQQIDELRLVEKDRDGAIQDAQNWKDKTEQLDYALCVLKRWMSKSPCDDNYDTDNNKGDSLDTTTTSEKDKRNFGFEGSISLSLGEEDADLQLHEMKHPDTNFASLVNVCRGVRETLRLTSTEANVVVEDLNKANEKISALSSRMVKAEKYLCKLWEENCSIRNEMKKKKGERKVLVKEVKFLLEKSKVDQDLIEQLKAANEELKRQIATKELSSYDNSSINTEQFQKMSSNMPKRQLGTPEKRLFQEIEDDLDCSLLFYSKSALNRKDDELTKVDEGKDLSFIVEETNSPLSNCPSENNTPIVSNAVERKRGNKDNLPHTLFEARDGNSSESESSDVKYKKIQRTFSPLRPKSLLDQITIQEQNEVESRNNMDMVENDLDMNVAPVNSSDFYNMNVISEIPSDVQNQLNVSELSHPLNKIDNDSITEPSEISFKSLVTNNAEATSRLSCPLLDVQQGRVAQDARSVYHLTFYSTKIGLQFQKCPNNIVSTGILTDAMTIDEDNDTKDNATASSRTDAELKMIASMYNKSSNDNTTFNNHCPVIFPKDIVLVCGFNGFDETANNTKPSLGARLIAFDGISIERGPWTFDTVRKAIKACERPLTLTFRDDYLSTEQRIILTKAAAEVVDTKSQRPSQIRQGIPRIINARRNDIFNYTKEKSVGDSNRYEIRKVNSKSFNDDIDVDYASVLTSDIKSQSSETWRTFSDAGSSSVFSTTFAPLMAGLVSKMKEDNKAVFTPDYFRRDPNSLETIAHHREFKASLL